MIKHSSVIGFTGSVLLLAIGLTALSDTKQRALMIAKVRSTTKTSVETKAKKSLGAIPIVCIWETYTMKLSRDAQGVFLTEPPSIRDIALSGQIGQVQWSQDHQSLLVCYKYEIKDKSMAICHYDNVKRRFDAPVPLDKALAQKGVYYDIHPGVFGWSRDQNQMLDASDNKGVHLQNLRTGARKSIVGLDVFPDSEYNGVLFLPDGKQFLVAKSKMDEATGDPIDQIWLFDISGKKIRKIGDGWRPALSPDGRYLLYISGQGKAIHRYDFQTDKTVTLIQGTSDLLMNAVYSPSGKMIAVMGLCEFVKGEHIGLFLTDSNGHFLRYLTDIHKLEKGVDSGDIVW